MALLGGLPWITRGVRVARMVHARDVARLTRHIIQVRMTSTWLSLMLVLALVRKVERMSRSWGSSLVALGLCRVGVVVFPSGVAG